jgi:hypothetical protein
MGIGVVAITAILFAANIPMASSSPFLSSSNESESAGIIVNGDTNSISFPASFTVVRLDLRGEPDRYVFTNGSLGHVFDLIAEQLYNYSTINLANQVDNNTRTVVEGIDNVDQLEEEFTRVANLTEITTEPTAQQEVHRIIVIECEEDCDVVICNIADVWCESGV